MDNKIYAIKKVNISALKDKEKTNALNEITLLSGIKHPNVVEYKDSFLCEDNTMLCLVMDHAAEGDAFMKIKKHKANGTRFPEAEIWNIVIQVLRGLKTLHENHILHRDIKSANVFLYEGNVVKIGDLNVSKIVKGGLYFTQTGTPYYASPEVWRDQPYDGKSDIWSVGCVLYELMMHDPPFKAANMAKLYKTVIRGKFPPINPEYGYSQDLCDLAKMMLKVDVKLRPTAKQILDYPIVKEMEQLYLQNSNETDDFCTKRKYINFNKNTVCVKSLISQHNRSTKHLKGDQ